MEKIYLFMAVILLLLLSLPEPTTKVANNPTPTGDIRSWIGILILLTIILLGMVISNLSKKRTA